MFRFFEYAKLVFFLDMHKFRAKTFALGIRFLRRSLAIIHRKVYERNQPSLVLNSLVYF